jgi:hypothetical protein
MAAAAKPTGGLAGHRLFLRTPRRRFFRRMPDARPELPVTAPYQAKASGNYNQGAVPSGEYRTLPVEESPSTGKSVRLRSVTARDYGRYSTRDCTAGRLQPATACAPGWYSARNVTAGRLQPATACTSGWYSTRNVIARYFGLGIRRRQFPCEEHTASVRNGQAEACVGDGDDRLARARVAAALC